MVAEIPQPLGSPLLHQEQCSQRGREPIWTRCSQPVPRAPGQPVRGHRTGRTRPLCEGAAFCPTRVYYPGTQLGRALHKHPAPPLPAQASAKGAGFHSQMNVKLSDLSLSRVQASPPCVQAAPPLHPSKGHLGSAAIVLEPKASLCFFSPRYFQAGFYLSTVCPQTYHFKWVRLLIDMNGVILDMKALLYLVSLVTAGASWSTDGVYLSCAKSVYWRN